MEAVTFPLPQYLTWTSLERRLFENKRRFAFWNPIFLNVDVTDDNFIAVFKIQIYFLTNLILFSFSPPKD